MEELYTRLGSIEGSLLEIRKNTDRIPDLGTRMALAESDISDIKPMVKTHEDFRKMGVGIFKIGAGCMTAITAWLSLK